MGQEEAKVERLVGSVWFTAAVSSLGARKARTEEPAAFRSLQGHQTAGCRPVTSPMGLCSISAPSPPHQLHDTRQSFNFLQRHIEPHRLSSAPDPHSTGINGVNLSRNANWGDGNGSRWVLRTEIGNETPEPGAQRGCWGRRERRYGGSDMWTPGTGSGQTWGGEGGSGGGSSAKV